MFPSDFLCFCDDMGDADLPIQTDAVIGCIAVTHQRSVKVLSEDGFCHLSRPMSVDMKQGEVLISCEPHIMPHAIRAPGGFIGMDHGRDPDLVTQIFIERRTLCRRFAVEPQGGSRNKLKAE